MLKAYRVHPGPDPYADGCLLVFENNARAARQRGAQDWPGIDACYIEMRALRMPDMDRYAELCQGDPWTVYSDYDLPDGVEFFNEDI